VSSNAYAHFIGIGGAGMSGIAHVLHERGVAVTGSDLKMSRYAKQLEDAGVPVAIGHRAENLGEPEVVVISSAIPESNPELAEARRRDLPVWPRAKMLAHLAEERQTIAVAGTHGKTTTSSMIATMLAAVGTDPTFLIGGELNDMAANARCGAGSYYVVEADESDGSFLYLDPNVAVITNVEADHLDHYADLAAVEAAFRAFCAKVPDDGVIVLLGDQPGIERVLPGAAGRVITYGESEGVDVRCHALHVQGLGHEFAVTTADGRSVAAKVRVPGRHNVLNATAAIAVAWHLGLDLEAAAAGVAAFSGVRRRFDLVGVVDGVTIVDDYAHHPTEVRATLAAARQGDFDRVWVVFQPHRYSRTAALGGEFGRAFGDADRLVLMDVYGAGEAPIPGVSGKTILDAVLRSRPRAQAAYFPHRADVEAYVLGKVRPGDLVLTMGAGDVTSIGGELIRALADRAGVRRSECR